MGDFVQAIPLETLVIQRDIFRGHGYIGFEQIVVPNSVDFAPKILYFIDVMRTPEGYLPESIKLGRPMALRKVGHVKSLRFSIIDELFERNNGACLCDFC
mmetsp:Transcript_6920/g.16909  ORF Transcript_6920/g.16909 Transcript_6920/m.16909 type:complete len:100 (-) Transcript_6920:248-547(-)